VKETSLMAHLKTSCQRKVSQLFSTPCKLAVEFLTVFGSTCCCRRGELSPYASYSKGKTWAPTQLILRF